jgi:hypothetical protein
MANSGTAAGGAKKGQKKETETGNAYQDRDITSPYKDKNLKITEPELLDFAKKVLLFLFVLVMLVFVSSYILALFAVDNETLKEVIKTILDITKTAVPSIVTLVLGFYYGRGQSTDGGSSAGSKK